MRIYETTFIINPQTDDTTIDKNVKDIVNIITSTDGKIIHEGNMGTRRLAYEINGLTQGFYASLLYEAPPEVLPKLDHHFKVNEAYIRDLTIRVEVDPQEIIKQTDPFGKHGSDRREGSGPGDRRPNHKPDSKSDETAKAEEAAPTEEAVEKAEPETDAPAVEPAVEETPKSEEAPEAAEEKPENEEL